MAPPPLSQVFDDDAKLPQSEIYSESSLNSGNKADDALNIHRGAIRVPSPDPSILSIDDAQSIRLGRNSDYLPPLQSGRRHASRSPAPLRVGKGRLRLFWIRNKGLALIMIAQMFGTMMNVSTRMLEMEGNDGKGYHPFQILFCRMGLTVICSSLYMWYMNTEHFPWGMRDVRPLLVARGLLGFFGVFGMYYSLLYLPLADATVITFLAPGFACWACSLLINEPFTRMEQIATYVSLFGVVLIARPMSLFASTSHSVPPASADGGFVPANVTSGSPDRLAVDYADVTPIQRATAVGLALMGVLGATGAITTLRWIGKRAHPLISVQYFSVWCTIVSFFAMLFVPGVGFLFPRYLKDWCLLLFLGICGFVTQFLLAAGLQYEKSSRATNMLYTQMLFALMFDKLVWGTTPGTLSIIGSSLILGSAIYVALHKEDPKKVDNVVERGVGEEERGLISLDVDGQVREVGDVDIPMRALRT